MLMKITGYAFLLIINLILIEAIAFVAGSLYVVPKFEYLFSQLESRAGSAIEKFDDYLRRRDAVLGWPSSDVFGGRHYDASGARPSPAFPEIGTACVSLYGDSFTFGANVDVEHAWGNLLARRLGCRVANYGVPAYGTDQAFLRFSENMDDESGLAVMGIWPGDAARNLNQYRDLLAGNHGGLGFKPRFVVDDQGSLRLIPLPKITKEEFAALLDDPAAYLEHEYFLPGSPGGPIPWRFPYSWHLLKAVTHERVLAGFAEKRTASPFYEAGHPNGGLTVMTGILVAFKEMAEKRDMRWLIVIFPSPGEAEFYLKTGSWAYQPILDAAKGYGIEVHNLGPDMIEALGDRDFCQVMHRPDSCGGHYGQLGNEILASAVASRIEQNDLLSKVASLSK